MKIKRTYLIATVVIVITILSVFIYWYEVPMLSLSVKTDKNTYSPNESIKIIITIKNNGLQARCMDFLDERYIYFYTPDNKTYQYQGPLPMCIFSMKVKPLGEYKLVYVLNNTTKSYWGNFTQIGRYEVFINYRSDVVHDCDDAIKWYGELNAKAYFYITR